LSIRTFLITCGREAAISRPERNSRASPTDATIAVAVNGPLREWHADARSAHSYAIRLKLVLDDFDPSRQIMTDFKSHPKRFLPRSPPGLQHPSCSS
jgi:hypothetical protein